MIYLDSCALVKLILPESESVALDRYLVQSDRHATSSLVRTEVRRALRRHDAVPERFAFATELFSSVLLIGVSTELLDAAGMLPDKTLRSLDAIHLATAQRLGSALTQFVTYDKRLANAAQELGIPVVAPV